MAKKNTDKLQFRYYEIPQNEPVLALLGAEWIRNYGEGIDYLHFHNLLEIGICHDGEGELIYEEEIIPYGKGTLTVIPANYPHTTNSKEGIKSSWEYIYVDLDGFLSESYPLNHIEASNIADSVKLKANCLDKNEYPKLAHLIMNICDEMRDKHSLYQDAVRGNLLSLLIEVVRINGEAKGKIASKKMSGISMVSPAIDLVSERYAEPLTVQDLANECHMSETHFRRVFDKCMSMKPMEYINLVRVKGACEYMKKHDDSMNIVAMKCGFVTTSTMNRNFRRILDISPFQWKRNAGNYEGKLLDYKISAQKGW